MSKEDFFRADSDKDFVLPPCPYCNSKKVHIEHLNHNSFRVSHQCKITKNHLRTPYCSSPEKAVNLYLSGKYEYFSGKKEKVGGYIKLLPEDNPLQPKYGTLLLLSRSL